MRERTKAIKWICDPTMSVASLVMLVATKRATGELGWEESGW